MFIFASIHSNDCIQSTHVCILYLGDCLFNGVTYSDGDSFPAGDGCNTWSGVHTA